MLSGYTLASYYILLLALVVLQANTSSNLHTTTRRGKVLLAASHSNFLRSNFYHRSSGAQVWCRHNASICSDPSRNPKGGVCCFNAVCKQTQSDEHNCGGCNKACSYGLSCCDGRCVDLMTDSQHCGRCNSCCHHNVACEFGLCGYGDGGYYDRDEEDQGSFRTDNGGRHEQDHGSSRKDNGERHKHGKQFKFPRQW